MLACAWLRDPKLNLQAIPPHYLNMTWPGPHKEEARDWGNILNRTVFFISCCWQQGHQTAAGGPAEVKLAI